MMSLESNQDKHSGVMSEVFKSFSLGRERVQTPAAFKISPSRVKAALVL